MNTKDTDIRMRCQECGVVRTFPAPRRAYVDGVRRLISSCRSCGIATALPRTAEKVVTLAR